MKLIEEYNRLLKVKIFQQGKNQWRLLPVEKRDGGAIRRKDITFRGDDEKLKLLLRRLKAKDNATDPPSKKNRTYQQMIDTARDKSDPYIWIWLTIWNNYKDGNKIMKYEKEVTMWELGSLINSELSKEKYKSTILRPNRDELKSIANMFGIPFSKAEAAVEIYNDWSGEGGRTAKARKKIDIREKTMNERRFDLGAGHLGNGTVIYNKAKEIHGDYEKIAHVDDQGNISWYIDNPPREVINFVKSVQGNPQWMYKENVITLTKDLLIIGKDIILEAGDKIEILQEEMSSPEVAREVKNFFKNKGIAGSCRSGKGKAQYIRFFPNDSVPNNIRKGIIGKLMPDANILDWNNINYGNIRSNEITLRKNQWIKFLNL